MGIAILKSISRHCQLGSPFCLSPWWWESLTWWCFLSPPQIPLSVSSFINWSLTSDNSSSCQILLSASWWQFLVTEVSYLMMISVHCQMTASVIDKNGLHPGKVFLVLPNRFPYLHQSLMMDFLTWKQFPVATKDSSLSLLFDEGNHLSDKTFWVC